MQLAAEYPYLVVVIMLVLRAVPHKWPHDSSFDLVPHAWLRVVVMVVEDMFMLVIRLPRVLRAIVVMVRVMMLMQTWLAVQ